MDKKIPAVANNTRGGKSNMEKANPQKPDTKPMFMRKGIKVRDDGPDSWGIKNLERYEHD